MMMQMPIDILWGSAGLRTAVDAGASAADVAAAWRAGLERFVEARATVLMS